MYILAVTSCPVGIAHTYMAAANLKKAAKKRGIDIKIETQGAQGLENEITKDDIARADGAIIASDIKIKFPERFEDLPVLECKVQEAVKDALGILDELLEAIS
ncbi:fructose PTS transporter subunit IIB [Tissierella sp. MSJ-40]|uniref:Fructose PTS transporter subunit IIB n=1 Tax=Tissierella simiarum TaxID=2841534 RepID=A0ABS6E296_9FIRM|nr:fructose PTS transporter subunit IIB [Tissierella simiarum]MBU5437028.1 fructose PTS transporter subunit IIB [Tissierella simiarum]